MTSINDRLIQLRNTMKEHQIDAYIIPSSDPHNSEYVPIRFQSRSWISGFTGSAGTIVITQDHAGVWTDGRYYLQVEQETAQNDFVLHKLNDAGQSDFLGWLENNLKANSTVGIDGLVFTQQAVQQITQRLKNKNIEVNTKVDLIEAIWNDRPDFPEQPIYEHAIEFVGAKRADKIAQCQDYLAKHEADFLLLTGLDDIAWLLNLRGSDVHCNPVFIAYCFVTQKETHLFVDANKIPSDIQQELNSQNILLHPYHNIFSFAQSLNPNSICILNHDDCNAILFEKIACKKIHKSNIVRHWKAVKAPNEIQHIRNAMEADAVALTKMYMWLEQAINQNKTIKETDISDKLIQYRSEHPYYKGESFDAIVGFRGNGAIIHYKANPDTCATISGSGMLLIDSGGQYLNGTTDITRTTYIGEPSKEEKLAFTLVLQGCIALDRARFPKGTKGVQLDTLARMFLWQNGLNYGHGTGHGVGYFLNVHEPPQGYTPGLSTRGKTTMIPGMITSDEPGYYKPNHFGIRIENLLLTTEDPKTEGFLCHETLTLFPIELKLIDETLINASEKAWLNRYHQEIYQRVSPHLNSDEQLWLKEKCKPLN